MAAVIYGIKNCNTMKKAFAWLDEHGVDYTFHDYRKGGVERARLQRWCDRAGWQTVLNRAGTTFRKLPDKAKANLDKSKAIALMLEQSSMIKRPVLETGDKIEIGFTPERYASLFGEGRGRAGRGGARRASKTVAAVRPGAERRRGQD